MKYQTDKVTYLHYETMYEKNLCKYIGTDVLQFQIGLGCMDQVHQHIYDAIIWNLEQIFIFLNMIESVVKHGIKIMERR